MAYYQIRNGNVDVYYYDSTTKRNFKIPRSETSELKGKSTAEIKAWIEHWEKRNGRARDKSKVRSAISTGQAFELYKDYFEQKSEDVSTTTLKNEMSHFKKYILHFFVTVQGCKKVETWSNHAPAFRKYLISEGLKRRYQKVIAQSLNRFVDWLAEERHITTPWKVNVRARIKKETPLKLVVTPEGVIEKARELKVEHPDFAIAILLGFFAGLRPGEAFALHKTDFLTGEAAAKRSNTYQRLKKVGWGTKLAVSVSKALNTQGLGSPKNHNSNGIVTVWHSEGAKELAKLVSQLEEGPIFHHTKTYLFKKYKRISGWDVTLHDLRRSCGLYLGRGEHGNNLEPFLLQDLLRHSNLETTQKYTRRPKGTELELEKVEQDFEDIV